jgi:hypothetical protein
MARNASVEAFHFLPGIAEPFFRLLLPSESVSRMSLFLDVELLRFESGRCVQLKALKTSHYVLQ